MFLRDIAVNGCRMISQTSQQTELSPLEKGTSLQKETTTWYSSVLLVKGKHRKALQHSIAAPE